MRGVDSFKLASQFHSNVKGIKRCEQTKKTARPPPQNKEYTERSTKSQAIRHSSVIFVAPYWNYQISCLKVQLAPLAQDADSEKWNISLDYVKKKSLEP